MALFNKSPEAKLQALRAALDKMAEQRAAADAAVLARDEDAVKLACEGASASAQRDAEIEVERAKTHVGILAKAHVKMAAELVVAEKKAADEDLQKLIDADVNKKEAARVKYKDKAGVALAALSDLLAASLDMDFVPENRPLTELVAQLVNQTFPPAFAVVDREGQVIIRSVKDRRMPVMVAPPALVATPAVQIEPLETAFTLSPMKYVGRDTGVLETAARYVVLRNLTKEQKQNGIEDRKLVELTDKRCRQNILAHGSKMPPDPALRLDLYDLDRGKVAPPPPPKEPVPYGRHWHQSNVQQLKPAADALPPGFERLPNMREPYTITVDPKLAVGHRAAEVETPESENDK